MGHMKPPPARMISHIASSLVQLPTNGHNT
jgi:hypothetical protein